MQDDPTYNNGQFNNIKEDDIFKVTIVIKKNVNKYEIIKQSIIVMRGGNTKGDEIYLIGEPEKQQTIETSYGGGDINKYSHQICILPKTPKRKIKTIYNKTLSRKK